MLTLTRTARIFMIGEPSELDRLRRLDSQAVAQIYDRYFPEVYRYIRYRLGDDQLAEDTASDVFVSLLEAVRAGRGPDTNLRGWLIGTARHMVTDHVRRIYHRPLEALSEEMVADGVPLLEEVEDREKKRMLFNTLVELTDEQQHLMALRFGQGYSLEETAALMKKSVNAVKAMQFRALAALQRRMDGRNETALF